MNLLYMLVDQEKRLVEITSSVSGEGKSTIAANLAISCAMSGKRVLLIDADLRRGCQQEIFGYDSKHPGLSELIMGTCITKEAIIPVEHSTLHIMPAGHLPPNPA